MNQVVKHICVYGVAIVLLFSAVAMVFKNTEGQSMNNPEVNKYYFFDHRIIDAVSDAELVLGTSQKTVTDATWLDQYAWNTDTDIPDWEQKVTIMYPYVYYDAAGVSVDGTYAAPYKIWYHAWYSPSPTADYDWRDYIIDATNSKNVDLDSFVNTAKGTTYATATNQHVLCYMESEDGIHWTRPDCGEYYYRTQEGDIVGTNIVLIGHHGPGVVKNEHPEAGKTEPLFILASNGNRLAVSWSEDGIHWEAPVNISTDPQITSDTHNQIFWSPEENCYVVITRGFEDHHGVNECRLVLRLNSTSELKTIRDAGNQACWTSAEIVLTGNQGAQPYSVPILHAGEGYYIGAVSVADFTNDGNGVLFQVHTELVWSPDTINWYHIQQGKPFIANAETFALSSGNDYGMIYSAAPVVTEEGTKFFYAATPELHYFSWNQIPADIKAAMTEKVPAAVDAQTITRTPTLNVVSIANDHYAGYSGTNGIVQTKRFQISGNSLKLTADVASGGSLTVAILDELGNAIDGFTHTDCTAITGNVIDANISWTGELSSLVGRSVSFEICLNQATIYTMSGNLTAIESVELIPSAGHISLIEGEKQKVTVQIVPEDQYNAETLIFSSLNPDVAVVAADGTITGMAPGRATVRVQTKDGLYGCEISVVVSSVDNILWAEDFENGFTGDSLNRIKDGNTWTTADGFGALKNALCVQSEYAHSGNYIFKNANSAIALIEKDYGAAVYQKVVNVWFYDEGVSKENETFVKVLSGSSPLVGLGVYATYAPFGTKNENYTYLYSKGVYVDTGIARTEGWHLFTFDFTKGYPDLYIDSQLVVSLEGIPEGATGFPMTGFTKVWAGWFVGSNSNCAFDHITITDALPWNVGIVKDVEDFTATYTGDTVRLQWTNPINPNWYEKIVIVRNTGHMPTDMNDGTVIATITDSNTNTFIDSSYGNQRKAFYGVYNVKGDVVSQGVFDDVSFGNSLPNCLLYEDFEFGFDENVWNRIKDGSTWVTAAEGYGNLSNAIIEQSDNAHSGTSVFKNRNGNIALVEKDFGDTTYQKVVSVWFYDDGVSKENETFVKVLSGSSPLVGLGVYATYAPFGIKNENYTYLYSKGVYADTGIARTEGWHLFTFDFTKGYPALYIDSKLVVRLEGIPEGATGFPMTNFTKVWAGWFVGSNSGCAFDDISITDTLSLAGFTSATPELKESIALHFQADVHTGSDENVRVKFVFKGQQIWVDGVQNGTQYTFTLPGILPQDTGKTISAEIYIGDTLKDTVADYSIKKYCMNLLARSTESDTELRALLVAILNYGAAAQTYFENETENLANADLSGTQRAYLTNYDMHAIVDGVVTDLVTGTPNDDYKWTSATIALYDLIKVRFKFAAANVTTTYIKIGERIYGEQDFVSAGNGYYYLYTDGIYAMNFDAIFSAVFVDVNGVQIGEAVAYSVHTYIDYIASAGSAGVLPIVQAVYNYGMAASAYAA